MTALHIGRAPTQQPQDFLARTKHHLDPNARTSALLVFLTDGLDVLPMAPRLLARRRPPPAPVFGDEAVDFQNGLAYPSPTIGKGGRRGIGMPPALQAFPGFAELFEVVLVLALGLPVIRASRIGAEISRSGKLFYRRFLRVVCPNFTRFPNSTQQEDYLNIFPPLRRPCQRR